MENFDQSWLWTYRDRSRKENSRTAEDGPKAIQLWQDHAWALDTVADLLTARVELSV